MKIRNEGIDFVTVEAKVRVPLFMAENQPRHELERMINGIVGNQATVVRGSARVIEENKLWQNK